MTSAAFLLVLLVAAILESGGDAIVRIGLHSHSSVTRLGFFVLGAAVLFFLVAQAINWFGFGLQPTLPIIIGGTLIIAGGLTIAFWGG